MTVGSSVGPGSGRSTSNGAAASRLPPDLSGIRPELPSSDAISAYGALCFLYMHSACPADWPVFALRRIMQPAIDLTRARIFFHEGVPRAACTWAHLRPGVEARMLAGQPIRSNGWRSGLRLWLMEIIAPYEQGTGAMVFRTFMKEIPERIRSFRYRRIGKNGKPARIMEASRLEGGSWRARIIKPAPQGA